MIGFPVSGWSKDPELATDYGLGRLGGIQPGVIFPLWVIDDETKWLLRSRSKNAPALPQPVRVLDPGLVAPAHTVRPGERRAVLAPWLPVG